MFDALSRGFENALFALRGQARLTEDNLAPALAEVRRSLLEADVGVDVVRSFLDRVKTKALGEVVKLKDPTGRLGKVRPQDHFVFSCYEEMVALMKSDDQGLTLTGSPSVVLMVGLQGSGKTTTSGKLAKMLTKQGKRVMLVAADIYRPAAVDQLLVLGRRINVPVFTIRGMAPVELARAAVSQAKATKRDVVIIDTAGRLAIDEALMAELDGIKAAVNPQEVLFVADSMIGQDAVTTASTFHERLSFTGFILTKLDGDARGGAALSIREVTGKPVKFLTKGEDLDAIEAFRPEGLAQQILGFGDVVGLMQRFEANVDEKTAEDKAKKLLEGTFSYDDFVDQLNMIRKMGSLRDLLSSLPFMNKALRDVPPEAIDDREMDRTLAIIQSMTKEERRIPDVLNPSRIRRIAKGSGRTVEDVESLHTRFLEARKMMKDLGKMMGGGMPAMPGFRSPPGGGFPGMGGGFPGMGGGFPGMGGGAPTGGKPAGPALSAEEKIAARKAAQQARKDRGRGR